MKYRVFMKSAPGMWATYDGHVDINLTVDEMSEDETPNHQIFRAAVKQLARTSFPDRPSLESWRLVRIEVLG